MKHGMMVSHHEVCRHLHYILMQVYQDYNIVVPDSRFGYFLGILILCADNPTRIKLEVPFTNLFFFRQTDHENSDPFRFRSHGDTLQDLILICCLVCLFLGSVHL